MNHAKSDHIIYQADSNDEWFKLVAGNRRISEPKLKRMETALLENNWLHLYPIVTDSAGHVIDGQHRLVIARKLNLTIYYVLDPRYAIMDMAATNTVVTSWELADYLNFWAVQGELEYQEVVEFLEEYPRMRVSNILHIRRGRWSEIRNQFRSGAFEFVHRDLCHEICELTDYLESEIGLEWVWQRNPMVGLRILVEHPDFDADRFKVQAKRFSHHLHRRPSIADYEYAWQDMYNLGHSVNRVIFKRLT